MKEMGIEQLFHEAYPAAYRAAKAVCMDVQRAEDAVSEALVRMWKRMQRKPAVEDEKAYFVRIAVNEARRIIRKNVPLPDENIEKYAECIAAQNDDTVLYKEAAAELLRAVHQLPKGMQLPVKLHYYGGFSEKEAARMLGISYSAIKTRLSRARAKLREALEQDDMKGESYHEV